MTMSQKGGLWTSVNLLSLETNELLKTDTNPSFFDPDSDLCLRSLLFSGTERVSFRFMPPSTRYQFIELDVVCLGVAPVLLHISAAGETQASTALTGEIVIAGLLATPGVVRTYRFPFLSEIETFIFSGFTAESPVNIKAIRFFTTPSKLLAGVAPETTPSLLTNTAHLVIDDAQVPRVGDIYQIEVPPADAISASAVFTFDSLDVSHGLVKILISQTNHADVSINVNDQPSFFSPYELTTGYAEIFVTGEQKTVSLTFSNHSATEIAHICVELDNWQAIPDTNAFGVVGGRIVSPLAGILEFICGGGSGGGSGEAGPPGPQGIPGETGPQGPIGPAGPAGSDGLGAGLMQSVEFTASGTWTVPTGVTGVWISGIGGGAGGWGGSANMGPGGGSGEEGTMIPMAVVPGTVMPVTIGAGGAAGSASNTPAGMAYPGGTTTFGILSFLGGRPGALYNSGGPGGGWGGGASTSIIGASGTAESSSFFGGGSGGAGGGNNTTPGYYGAGSGGTITGGVGGAVGGGFGGGGGGAASPYGAGGAGGAGNNNGLNGVGYGSGGGGCGGSSGTTKTGGVGKSGYLIILFVA